LQRSIAAAQALAVHGLEAECCVPPLGAQYRDNRYIVGMSGTDILPWLATWRSPLWYAIWLLSNTGKLKTNLRIQNVTLCRVSVSPVADVTTGESVVTPNSREFHFLPGGLFVA